MTKKKITLELDEHTFAMLEMLAVGMHAENEELYPIKADKQHDDFRPMVRDLLVDVANSLSSGISRPGSWERGVVSSLTGWQGTYKPGMAADCIKEEVESWNK